MFASGRIFSSNLHCTENYIIHAILTYIRWSFALSLCRHNNCIIYNKRISYNNLVHLSTEINFVFFFFEIFLFRPQIQESFKSTIEHIFTIFHIMCIRYPKWNQNHLNPSNNIIAKCIPCSYVAAFEKIYIFFKDLWDTLGWRKRKLQCGNVPSLFEVNLNRGFSSHYYLEDWMHVRKFIQIALVDTNMFFCFV